MTDRLKIEIKKRRIGWRVQVGVLWASGLGPDEALGVIAAYLFEGIPPPYLRTTEQYRNWRKALRRPRGGA